jgi:hypothetical protein
MVFVIGASGGDFSCGTVSTDDDDDARVMTTTVAEVSPSSSRRRPSVGRHGRGRGVSTSSSSLGRALTFDFMASLGFPPAAQPDIVRAAQKDDTYATVRLDASSRASLASLARLACAIARRRD